MGDNPQRSWSKVNTQLWSLAMRDPLPSKFNFSSGSTDSSVQQAKKTDFNEWKDVCCWRYNKRRCNKKANECKFQHRCSHCGGHNHIFLNCTKRRKDNNTDGNWGNHTESGSKKSTN